MPGFKNPLGEKLRRARELDAETRERQRLITADEFRKLETQLEDAAPAARFHKLVADLFPGDEPLATPALGVGQHHLYAVPAPVIQIGYGREIRARRRGLSSQRPTGGSAA